MNTKPNILLVVVDCARSDKWLGPGERPNTPNIDRLAAEGVSLPTTITEKSCTTPSFSTLLTARYSPRHGVHLVWGYKLPDEVPMLTDILAKHGYHTYAEVSGPLLPEMGLARGFKQYEYRAPCDHLHTEWGTQFGKRLNEAGYETPWFVMLHIWELHPHRYVAPEFNTPEHGADEYDRAIASLDLQLGKLFQQLPQNTLVVFTGDHGEKTTRETYRENTAVGYARKLLGVDDSDGMAPFSVASWAGPSVLQELYGKCTPMMRTVRLRDRAAAPAQSSRWQRFRDRLRLAYLTPFVYLTDLFALGAPVKLTNMLKRRGLLDPERARKKVARLTGAMSQDELLAMHMRMWVNSYKRNFEEGHMIHVYDFLVKVPLILHWPGVLPPGKRNERMVRQTDILPTILELVGIPASELPPCDGVSAVPLINDDPVWQPRPAYVSVTGTPADIELRGVRTEEFKYTYGPENPDLPEELYDLAADPGETNNIAAHHPDRCAELRALADRYADADTPLAEMELSAKDQAQVEKHLQELGYL